MDLLKNTTYTVPQKSAVFDYSNRARFCTGVLVSIGSLGSHLQLP